MTRETKIGLLVGLAFIIVIGILLSDHLTSSTEPPQAALTNAGNNVRQAVNSPGQPAPQPPQLSAPTNAGPNTPVPTRDELTPGPNPVSIVKIGPANGANSAATPPNVSTLPPVSTDAAVAMQQPSAAGPMTANQEPPITRAPANNSPASPIDQLAQRHGEELVVIDASGRAVQNRKPSRGSLAEYKAEPGDSLSKMAQKLMGSSNKANRDAIVAVNPSLKTDPNKVIVGRTYFIPTSPESTAAVLSNTATAQAPAVSVPTVSAPAVSTPVETMLTSPDSQTSASSSVGEYWYTVKPGDSLWRIATEQCGRAGAVAAIKELNKETLGGPERDQVITGTKIRLPGKPIAQAN